MTVPRPRFPRDDELSPGSFLSRLPPHTREALLAVGAKRRFEAGRVLLREGELSDHVELLLRGYVKVTELVGAVDRLMAIRVPGDIVGETAMLTGRLRTATVTACGQVTSTVVSGAQFHHFLRQYPQAAVAMAATMGERLYWANIRRKDFAAYPADVRVARVLIELARICGRKADDGSTVIAVQLSQTELATMVGVAEPTAQKAIRELREANLIRTGYRLMTIVDINALDVVANRYTFGADDPGSAGETHRPNPLGPCRQPGA